MKWGWLKTVGRVALGLGQSGILGPRVTAGTVMAAEVVEAISSARGKDKEDEAVRLVPTIVAGLNIGDRINAPMVQDAMRKVMQTYVAVQNTKVAAEEAVVAFEAARQALEALIEDAKS